MVSIRGVNATMCLKVADAMIVRTSRNFGAKTVSKWLDMQKPF
jgi:hypothetical protein